MPIAALSALPSWVAMWLFAGFIFAVCKCIAFARERSRVQRAGRLRALGFLCAWPGMDARAFFETRRVARPAAADWRRAAGAASLGAVLYWLLARRVGGELSAGWTGMLGLIFMLHFGTFDLLALAWRTGGVDAEPLMRQPARATSLAEFWGRRWNTAFNCLARDFVFRPLARRFGIRAAMAASFFISGVIHDAVISIPAGAGYGLPTLYFSVQALGIAIERSKLGRRLGLGAGAGGWLFVAAFTAGPAFWLFHPPFVLRIIVPMMKTTGAL